MSTDAADDDSALSTPKSPAPKRGQEEDDSAHEVAVNENVFSDDCYEILGLQHLRMRATANDIKKAYRILILKHHPDKMISSGFSEEEANAGFKKLNQAYEKMSNEDERRVYDSEDSKFDNSIPLDRPASDDEFYSTFRPVFDRNACWSSKTPVPRLGDAATPIAAVLSFYDFWTSFASWREFNADPELDINQASCREEKRWLQRQIDKEKKEKKTEENARVRTLVENARKWDPRVIKHKAELAAAAAAAKAEKERLIAEEKLAQVQAAKAAAEQKVREEAEDKERKKREKEEKEAMKVLLRDQRRRIRIKCEEFDMNRSHTEDLSLALPLEQLKLLADALERDMFEGQQLYHQYREEFLKIKNTQSEALKAARDAAAAAAASKQEEEAKSAWTQAEVALFIQAFNKFPGGMVDRWKQMAAFIGTRTPEEVVAKVKTFRSQDASGLMSTVKSEISAKAAPSVTSAAAAVTSSAAAATKSSPSLVAAAAPDAPAAAASSGLEEDDWTSSEQKALELALKEFPASMAPADRWKAIATRVPGRSAKDCVQRYKFSQTGCHLATLTSNQVLAAKAKASKVMGDMGL